MATGRDSKGRFVKGEWKGGPGNPLGKRIGQLRSALVDSVTEEDMAAMVTVLIAQAKGGDVAASKLVLSYTIGRPVEHDLVERLEALEHTLNERGEH